MGNEEFEKWMDAISPGWRDWEAPGRIVINYRREGFIGAMQQAQEPMICGHPKACLKPIGVQLDAAVDAVQEGERVPLQCSACEHERRAVEQLIQPLKRECDREWKEETPEQVVAIAANAIYWRDEEIKMLNERVKQAVPERDANWKAIRSLSPDPHYVERKELEARLEGAKTMQDIFLVVGSLLIQDADEYLADLKRQLAVLGKKGK